MTSEGSYVQLVNGVLTNVSVTPMAQVEVNYHKNGNKPEIVQVGGLIDI